MARSEDDGTASRSDPETRKASLLLSGLALTPDSALEVFRDRRAGDPALALEHLRQARDILDAVAAAIVSSDPAPWRQIEQAWSTLHQGLAPGEPVAVAPVRGPADPLAAAGIDVAALNRVKLDADSASTLPADSIQVVGDALPFREAQAQPPSSALDDDDPEPDALRETIGLDDDHPLSMTDEVPTDRTGPQEDEVTVAIDLPADVPLGAEIPRHLAALTVVQYAALCAECAVHPEWVDPINARYQVSNHQERQALDRLWKERMAIDDQLELVWRWHFARYEQLAKNR
ncbi:MAG: hypothetical protein DRI90_17810 [Deltaproteobacteria bacterium]|nr:MAG: hypothetical protein DRI90_17810 [Deltaproteobacteria bacterium]